MLSMRPSTPVRPPTGGKGALPPALVLLTYLLGNVALYVVFHHHFFYFCCFRCVSTPLTGVTNYVFCIYICCFIANFGYRTTIVSKQSQSHIA